MVSEPTRTLQDLVNHLGQYPEEAFLFVRDGLSFAADQVHGPETDAQRALHRYLAENELDWDDLVAKYHTGQLPEAVCEVIEAAGGCDRINRHVSGRELCWALRDYALQRWGIMARVVLESWRVRKSYDFGRIVFGFIDLDMMRRQDEDTLEDFEDVYSFKEAFDDTFRDGLPLNDADDADEAPDDAN